MIDSLKLSVPEIQHLLTFFLEYILENLMLPGKVENWVLISDMNGLNVATVPYGVDRGHPDFQRDIQLHAEQL